jgi:acyl-CoA reductase-like NAD-dependent aldehyde dehydrogenase
MRAASQGLVPVSLECGGKSAMVVFPDIDLDKVVSAARVGAFYNQGQVCNAACRILVHESIVERFTASFLEAVGGIQVGDPFDPQTTFGAVISERQLEKDLGYVAIGKQEGARCCAGGERIDRPGYFVPPTVFCGVRHEMRIAREEVFGPITAIIPFKDEDEAVAITNGTDYGLATGVWTRDISRALSVARAIQSGTVWINAFGPFDIAAPWTGLKQSGVGTEWGKEMLRFVTRPKNVWIAY